ncbi:helix-turn-helix domain-containing protein [Pseudomonas sp. EA_65y_Pfl1_P113]|uniref:helix-turn-helix domain-containing protein n=1 Tax=Pseudomonas sp. EA_65y_Pfl1_P113 TaxID=3088692 RepID=UPI0030DA68B9
MTYTQTAFTGRTGARPITALTRELTRRMKVVDATGIQVSKQDARRAVKALKGAIGVSNGAIETLMDLVQLTWEADWTDDRPLVVWPSNQHLAEGQEDRGLHQGTAARAARCRPYSRP